MDRTQRERRQQGFTLVELLVAMAIGLILMAALYQFFIAQQRQYGTQDDVQRMQQNARVAQDLVIKTVQQAGGFAPTTGTTISMRGLPILAASDRYLAVQYDDPYRPADQGVVTADEVVIFAVSKPTGAGTQFADDGDGSAQVNVNAYFDQNGNGVVENAELYGLRVPLVLTGPPYTFYRFLPDPANPVGNAPRMEAITADVENVVFRYFNQNGDPLPHTIVGVTIVPTPPPYRLTLDERARVRTVEMTLTLRSRNADTAFTDPFTPTPNTVGSYNAAGNAQATPATVTDGFRRRTFTTRVSPRNLSANVCGKITLTAAPGAPLCPNPSALTAVVTNQFGNPVAGTPVTFSLDATTGAVLSAGTANTNAAGEASTNVSYSGLSRAITISATTAVDCRPNGPQMFTLQNAVAVNFSPGFANRLQLTNLREPPLDTYVDAACTPNTWGFDATGFDVCGNQAAPNPALTFNFAVTAGTGTLASPGLDAASKNFVVTLPAGGGPPFSLASSLTASGTWVPTRIDVATTVPSTRVPPYGVLHTVPLHPAPPIELLPDPPTWLDALAPLAPATAHLDCLDLSLTTGPFRVVDCSKNPIPDDPLPGGFQLVPTLTGPGTLTLNPPTAGDYTLTYTLPRCTTPPGSSIQPTAAVELQSGGGASVDSAGPRAFQVDGCATCAVQVVKNPTPCEQYGTVAITGCNMTGRTIEVELVTTRGAAVGSFSPPLTPRVANFTHTFPSSTPLNQDIYVSRASLGDEITVTAYYPSKAGALWSCAAVLSVNTKCESLELFADNGYVNPVNTGGPITCLQQLPELHFRVKDCQASSAAALDEVRIELYAGGILYDREDVDLGYSATHPDHLISDRNAPLRLELDDGTDTDFDGVLRYPTGAVVRLIATYTDAVDGETCQETVDSLRSPADVCFYNALASYRDADLPPSLQVRWGDVAVEGLIDLRAAAPATAKRSTAGLSAAAEDRFLEVYVGKDTAGGGGYFELASGDTSSLGFRPFLNEATPAGGLGNYYQGVSNGGIRTLAPELDYQDLKSFAQSRGTYWFALSGVSTCPEGPEVHNPSSTTTACLTAVLTAGDPLVFVDAFGSVGSSPSLTAAQVNNSATVLPEFTLGNLFTGDIPNRVIYIAGSVTFTTAGGGSPITLTSPPNLDANYADNPFTGAPAWSPTEADLPIDPNPAQSTGSIPPHTVNLRGGLYLEGKAIFDGSPVIYGALVAERGVEYRSGAPEIWYDYGLRQGSGSTCTACGVRPATVCRLGVSIPASPIPNPGDSVPASVTGVLGTVTQDAGSIPIALFDLGPPPRVTGVNVGSTTMTLVDSLQPACPVTVPVTVNCTLGLSPSATNLTVGQTATVVANKTVNWSVSGGTAVTIPGALPNPAPSIQVQATQLGAATLNASILGTSCGASVGFTVACGLAVAAVPPVPAVLRPGVDTTTLQASGTMTALTWNQTSPLGPALVNITPVGPLQALVQAPAGAPASVRVTVAASDASGCTSAGTDVIVCPLAINAGAGTVNAGATLALTATGSSGSVAWVSSDPAIATVGGATGVVTGIAAGTVTITATDAVSPACTATANVVVNPPVWVQRTFDDFEAGVGNFTLGTNSSRYTASAFAHQGNAALNIESTNGTSPLTNNLTVAALGYTQLSVEFWYMGVSMEAGERFELQYSSDGGSNWSTVSQWRSGTEFANNSFNFVSALIAPPGFPFTNTVKIRFRCFASNTNDDVYIDEIRISGR